MLISERGVTHTIGLQDLRVPGDLHTQFHLNRLLRVERQIIHGVDTDTDRQTDVGSSSFVRRLGDTWTDIVAFENGSRNTVVVFNKIQKRVALLLFLLKTTTTTK